MDVELGELRFDGPQDVAVMLVGLVRVDATLDADLGRAAVDRVLTLLENLGMATIVGVDRVVLVARETTKRTAHIADIRKIDVAADDVADIVTTVLASGQVPSRDQRMKIHSPRAEQSLGISEGVSSLPSPAPLRAGRGHH